MTSPFESPAVVAMGCDPATIVGPATWYEPRLNSEGGA